MGWSEACCVIRETLEKWGSDIADPRACEEEVDWRRERANPVQDALTKTVGLARRILLRIFLLQESSSAHAADNPLF
ncbi:hypothetical protein [Paucibacter sp. KBW04]|uniref:hypothetical protein n=1 Tax=Paucibacter sp. KBW04 TaxID=2153361 RepID=UPI0018CC5529|nr:hypothetical protein [Paucibacter sp. KBW04]